MKLFYAALVLFYGLFFWWYGGSGKPVTEDELQGYIDSVTANLLPSDTDPATTIGYMRDLAASDNGDEFLMVNLMKLRERAQYPADSPWANETDAKAADARYSAAIVPLLLKRAGHPVLLGPITGRFIIEGSWADWHSIGIVRYRSVRDMLEMMVDMSAMNIAVHKWASMEQTQVFPVRATIGLFNVRFTVAVVLIFVALIVRALVGSLRSPKAAG